MGLFEKLTKKAKEERQRIVLPEGTEPRTLTAADRIITEGIADVILIGDPKEIAAAAAELSLTNICKARIVNPADEKVIEKYAPIYFDLRKKKGITIEEARVMTANPLYLGCLMIKNGDADGQVAGALNTTGNVLRAAFQVVKTKPGINSVSGAFSLRRGRNTCVCRLRGYPRPRRSTARGNRAFSRRHSPRYCRHHPSYRPAQFLHKRLGKA